MRLSRSLLALLATVSLLTRSPAGWGAPSASAASPSCGDSFHKIGHKVLKEKRTDRSLAVISAYKHNIDKNHYEVCVITTRTRYAGRGPVRSVLVTSAKRMASENNARTAGPLTKTYGYPDEYEIFLDGVQHLGWCSRF